MENTISILILAAGSSSRMGKIKQLLPWRGTTLLGNAILTANSSEASEVIVVLGCNAGLIKETLDGSRAVILENRDWAAGMGSSINFGIKYLLNKTPVPGAVLIMLCDQPLIDRDYLNKMINAYHRDQKKIIGSAYGDRVGVPALFGSPYFSHLEGLGSNKGARDVLYHFRDDTVVLDAGDILRDIDNEADYAFLLDSLK